MKKTLAVVIVFLLVFSGIGILISAPAEASNIELKIVDKRDEGLKASYDGFFITVHSEKEAAFIHWTIDGQTLGYQTKNDNHSAQIAIEEFEDLSSGTYTCIVQAYDIDMNPLYEGETSKQKETEEKEKNDAQEVIEKREGIEVVLERGRFITVHSEKEVKFVEWTINGKTLGYPTDKTNHRAQIDIEEFNLEPDESYEVDIKVYDFDMTPLYQQIKQKINKKSADPTITVIQEIPYKDGQLKAIVKGNKIKFLLNNEIFARGIINDDGTFYVPIDHNKQINTEHTKAYNVIRVKLTNQEQL